MELSLETSVHILAVRLTSSRQSLSRRHLSSSQVASVSVPFIENKVTMTDGQDENGLRMRNTGKLGTDGGSNDTDKRAMIATGELGAVVPSDSRASDRPTGSREISPNGKENQQASDCTDENAQSGGGDEGMDDPKSRSRFSSVTERIRSPLLGTLKLDEIRDSINRNVEVQYVSSTRFYVDTGDIVVVLTIGSHLCTSHLIVDYRLRL